ncbi:uncharacterized protein LOC132904087 [Amyelois transitella]|uniref:uncharacterized protein LOC132904087 n=1 Tax=Amyelois transitella TaxID=680683 RepID=UPI00298FED61|nr:uncharacterized protein LOC132904087 [Amyelois transitella]
MSVQRSPIGGSSSQPDLSKISNSSSDLSSVTFRKRKAPYDNECSCPDTLRDMRNEISRISSLLENYVENKLSLGEEVIQEMQNRKNREKNIVLFGVPEQISSTTEESLIKDEAVVFSTISMISSDIPKPFKLFRIGKPRPGKNRSIKVCFETPEPAKQLLRNRSKLRDGVKIFSDQTPSQQNYMKNLKEELRRRQDEGETDLTIKYINGTPAILKNSKNFNH